MPQTYKTKDGTQSGFVVGVGQIVDGKIEVPDGVIIENANLVKVEDQPQTAPAAPVASNTPVNPMQNAPMDQPSPPQSIQNVNKESN
jgi:hypothetical protein